jgi:hypothetical protein
MDNLDAWSNTVTITGTVANSQPVIATVTDSPDPIVRGQLITLTANTVSDPDGTVAKVEFYRDTNGNGVLDVPIPADGATPAVPGDQLLFTDSSATDGWKWLGVTTGFSVGSNTYFARAQDNQQTWGVAVSTTGTINNSVPTIGSLADSPDPLVAGQNLKLTAINVSDEASIKKVEFYRDTNNNGVLDIPIPASGDTPEVPGDQLLGTDSSSAGGWSFTLSTTGRPLGTTRYFVRAQDSDDAWSASVPAMSTIAKPCAVNGVFFNDRNGNGRKDSGETVLSGWRVFIDEDRDGRLDKNEHSVLTDKRGRWKLSPAQFGTTIIRFVNQRGWTATQPRTGALNIKLDSTACAAGKLFGVRRI